MLRVLPTLKHANVLAWHGLLGAQGRVVIAGLSNGYADYTVTYEEYQQQRYEGGSTIFGPHQLNARVATHAEWAPITRALQSCLHEWRNAHSGDPARGLPMLHEQLGSCIEDANLTNLSVAVTEATVAAVLTDESKSEVTTKSAES